MVRLWHGKIMMTNAFSLYFHSVSVAAADQQTKEWLYSNKVRLNSQNIFCFNSVQFWSPWTGWGATDGDEWGHRTACVSTCRCQQVGNDWRDQESLTYKTAEDIFDLSFFCYRKCERCRCPLFMDPSRCLQIRECLLYASQMDLLIN